MENLKGCDFLIEMKIASENDLVSIKKFSNRPIKEDVDFYMIIMDGERLLGYAAVTLPCDEFAVINELYILPSQRGMGLGDGLLRATLNAIDLKGIHWILIEGHKELNSFLIHEELSPLNKDEIPFKLISSLKKWDKDYGYKEYYYCQPREFFSKKCKGSKMIRR